MTSRGGQFQRVNRAGPLRDLVRIGVAAGAAALVVAGLVAPVTSNVGVLLTDTTQRDTVITAPVETSVHARDIKVRLRPPPPNSTPDATSDLVALDVLEGVIASPPTYDGAADASLTPDVRRRLLPDRVAFHPAELLGLPPGPPTPTIPTVEVEDPPAPVVVVVRPTPKKGSPPALTTTSAPRKFVPPKSGKPAKSAKPAKPGKGHENHNRPGDRGAPDWANGDARSDAGGDRGSAPEENPRDEKKNPNAGGPKEGKSEKAATPESSRPGNSDKSDKKAKAKKSDEADPSAEYPADEVEPTG